MTMWVAFGGLDLTARFIVVKKPCFSIKPRASLDYLLKLQQAKEFRNLPCVSQQLIRFLSRSTGASGRAGAHQDDWKGWDGGSEGEDFVQAGFGCNPLRPFANGTSSIVVGLGGGLAVIEVR